MTEIAPRDLGFGILFDLIRDAVIVADVETERIALLNPAAAAMFGYEHGDAVGLPLETIVPPELRHAHRTGIEAYRQTRRGALVESEAAVSVPAVRRDGERIAIDLRLSPISAVFEGRYVMALIRDVTERNTLVEELAAAAANLEIALQTEQDVSRHLASLIELKDEFIAMLSHDLGGPLSAISGYADLLRRSWDRLQPQQRAESLDAIERSARRMTALVRDLLEAARLDAGAMTYQLEDLDIVAALTEAVGELGPAAAGRVDVQTSGAAAEHRVWVDRARHAQVVANLVGNALKFSPPETRVTVAVSDVDGMVEVSVRDRGPGIDEADRPLLFERFRRVGTNTVDGSGLGLYITRRLVEGQGGTVVVDAPADGGTVFRYTLPSGPPGARSPGRRP